MKALWHSYGSITKEEKAMFYRLRYSDELVVIVVTLIAYGSPVQAIVVAFHLDERTVMNWQEQCGQHCKRVHQHLVQQPQELGHVPADGMRIKAIQRVFRTPLPTGKPGGPRLISWPDIHIGQVIKRYQDKRVVDVTRHMAQGSKEVTLSLIKQSNAGSKLNTAFIECINATLRSRLAALARRSRALLRNTTNFDLLSIYIVASQFFRQQFTFYAYNVFVQLVLELLKVWCDRFPLSLPFQDELAQLSNGRTSQNRIRVAKFHRKLRVEWNLLPDPNFARRFRFCQAACA